VLLLVFCGDFGKIWKYGAMMLFWWFFKHGIGLG
jgi:hypothetical protein